MGKEGGNEKENSKENVGRNVLGGGGVGGNRNRHGHNELINRYKIKQIKNENKISDRYKKSDDVGVEERERERKRRGREG